MSLETSESATDPYVLAAQKLNHLLTARYVQLARSLQEALSSRLRHTMQRYKGLAGSAEVVRIACDILLSTIPWNENEQEDFRELAFVWTVLDRMVLQYDIDAGRYNRLGQNNGVQVVMKRHYENMTKRVKRLTAVVTALGFPLGDGDDEEQ